MFFQLKNKEVFRHLNISIKLYMRDKFRKIN